MSVLMPPWNIQEPSLDDPSPHTHVVATSKDTGKTTVVAFVSKDLPEAALLISLSPELLEMLTTINALSIKGDAYLPELLRLELAKLLFKLAGLK